MKNLVIEVNSFLLYAALAVLVVFGFIILGTTDEVWISAGWIVGGFVGWCVLSGFWFVQVAILDELKKLNRKGK